MAIRRNAKTQNFNVYGILKCENTTYQRMTIRNVKTEISTKISI